MRISTGLRLPNRVMSDVAQQPGRHRWADPLSCCSLLPVAAISSVRAAFACLIFLPITASSVISSEAS
jgi:hypothetical protein